MLYSLFFHLHPFFFFFVSACVYGRVCACVNVLMCHSYISRSTGLFMEKKM